MTSLGFAPAAKHLVIMHFQNHADQALEVALRRMQLLFTIILFCVALKFSTSCDNCRCAS